MYHQKKGIYRKADVEAQTQILIRHHRDVKSWSSQSWQTAVSFLPTWPSQKLFLLVPFNGDPICLYWNSLLSIFTVACLGSVWRVYVIKAGWTEVIQASPHLCSWLFTEKKFIPWTTAVISHFYPHHPPGFSLYIQDKGREQPNIIFAELQGLGTCSVLTSSSLFTWGTWRGRMLPSLHCKLA